MSTLACVLVIFDGLSMATALDSVSTGRTQLFSDAGGPLPDVVMSESFLTVAEGDTVTYTVALTHAPGMREDETIDLRNDEVRIYLTSSQEVYQQDDQGDGSVGFEQRRNHRTQLQIETNDVDGNGAQPVTGPLPYVYVPYSTVNTEQSSPVHYINGNAVHKVVCPLPTHPAFAVLDVNNAPITGTVITVSPSAAGFDGCYQIIYNGFAPVLDACSAGYASNKLITSCTESHANAWTHTVENPLTCVPNLPIACMDQLVATFDGVSGLLTPKPAGGGSISAFAGTSASGHSDYRIYSDGAPVLRDIPDPAAKCRYCSAPGLTCDESDSQSCPVVTVGGGDQQPEEANWKITTYSGSGPSWRGDLSSSAQLIFDSTNWDVPQTVRVTARDDDVFEPEVYNRGQDAYVHHYVVAQDVNLQHTYYEDIAVNDMVVSVADDDPAVVIESAKEVHTYETSDELWQDVAASISYRLASEPMFHVKVYLQSGDFFKPGTVPSLDTAMPDDEQVIYQDSAQYFTCFESSGPNAGRYTDCANANAVHGCANNGQYVALVSGGSFLPTTAWPATKCTTLTTQASCESHVASGCIWDGACSAGSAPFTARDLTCGSFGDSSSCVAHDGCNWDSSTCINVKYGYDCRSYIHFSTTNWNTWQKVKIVGVPDNADEVVTVSPVGVIIESRDWYYNSAGSKLLDSHKTDYQPIVGGVLWGTQYTTQQSCEARSTFLLQLATVTSSESKFTFDSSALPVEINSGDEVLVENHDAGCVGATCCAAAGTYIVDSVDANSDSVVVTTSVASEDTGSQCTMRLRKEPVLCIWTEPSLCKCTVDRSVFDNRKGVHIPRYPRIHVDTDLFGVTASDYGFITDSPSTVRWEHLVDANNAVTCCEAPVGTTGGAVRTIDGKVYDPVDPLQSISFEPEQYASRGLHIGATVTLNEPYGADGGRGVTISRTDCEATEGRRYWFDQFNSEPDPIGSGLYTTYGLFTTEGAIQNAATQRSAADTSEADDGWTMKDVSRAEGTHFAGMTAPVCPYTIVLNASPLEGRTAVINLREDVGQSTLRDHELFFFEEPSFRVGTDQNTCGGIGGSVWIKGGCFINNVPCYPPGTTNFFTTPRRTATAGLATGEPTCENSDIILARGSTDLDVMFTDVDWDVPRRITAIALNDDVDEPTEIRTIHHSVSPCGVACDAVDVSAASAEADCLAAGGGAGGSCAFVPAGETVPAACRGSNHNTGSACLTDTLYTHEVPVAPVDVNIVDDDIADLVILCGGGYTRDGATSQATTVNEEYIGAYDGSGEGNFGWVEYSSLAAPIERSGPNAEDGITGSEFGGSISLVGGSIVEELPSGYSVQISTDGIGGGGKGNSAGLDTDGYVTDLDYNVCDNFAGNPIGRSSDSTPYPSPKCFNPSNVQWTHYDPYYDRYVAAGPTTGTPYSSDDSRNTFGGTPIASVRQHNRGFKGIGGSTLAEPAPTEPEDRYACTIHSRECMNDVLGDDDQDGIDSQGNACQYGTFQVRLNSSPGTKHVRRQYIGEAQTVVEEELIYIVVSPDATAQTRFDPAQVTFTHTGGDVDGHSTFRWDEPATFKVVPIDDKVDERAGVVIDFTSFTVSQSHFNDLYWSYTKPFQTKATVGSLIDALDVGSTGRVDDHTPFRHHIRTIHTDDNDFSGVRLESRTVTQTLETSGPHATNVYTHDPVSAAVTEGETFAFYSIRLDTQPRKPQRQAGTNPNVLITKTPISGGSCDITSDTIVSSSITVTGYDDYSSYTRPATCGSIEHEETYWVDVTVTQSIHIDLAKPESCPSSSSWGGGESPDHTYLNPRFPYNAKNDLQGNYQPINELTQTAADMDGYLSTCGGWQHDATFRFTAADWNVPQYVYLYAHNDRDAATTSGHVETGGNEDETPTVTTLKHYVETEDTPDNMRRAGGYVQRNKHGGVYTTGNLERFPFGVIDGSAVHGHNRVTGRTTFGYNTYQNLHEFVNPTTRPVCYGTSCMGLGSGTACCGTTMGMVPVRGSVNLLLRGSIGLTGYTTNVDQIACPGYAVPAYTIGPDGTHTAGTVCQEGITGLNKKQPWMDDGTPCHPLYAIGEFCTPKYATPTGGLKFPPLDVVVAITDNDAVEQEVVVIEGCRQTQLLQYTDSGADIDRMQWLTDYNCGSNDVGGLPGWPISSE